MSDRFGINRISFDTEYTERLMLAFANNQGYRVTALHAVHATNELAYAIAVTLTNRPGVQIKMSVEEVAGPEPEVIFLQRLREAVDK